jgi:predicted dehydrogenase
LIGIGLVGAGLIGDWHVRGVRESGVGEVRSVYSRNHERISRFAHDWDIENAARSYDEMLERADIDAVIVSTPTDTHKELTLRAIEAGKHVLCEKPFSLNAPDSLQMVQAAERAGVFLACASARGRSEEQQKVAHALIEAGELGDVYHVRSTDWRLRGRPGHHMYHGMQWWLDQSQGGGGVLIDNGVYMIDSALWMLGFPKVVSVTAQLRQAVEVPPPAGMFQNVEDHAVVFIQCENQKSAIIEVAWVSNMYQQNGISMDIHGTKAGLKSGLEPLVKITSRAATAEAIAEAGNEYAAAHPIQEVLVTREHREHTLDTQSHTRGVTTDFVLSLDAGKQPMTPGRQALEVMRVVDAAYESAARGGSVRLEEPVAQQL